MRIGKTIPPAASALGMNELLSGAMGLFSKNRAATLEDEIKEAFGARYAFAVSSGKAALTVILRALSALSGGKQVVIPAYTCYSVPSAVIKAGLDVVPCDINDSTFDFDPASLKRAIGKDTLCVVAGNLFGIPSDVKAIKEICRAKGVFLVEDGAQAMGGVLKGGKIGTFGDAGFFSLGRGKNITSSSGGIIITSSEETGKALERELAKTGNPGVAGEITELLKTVLMALLVRPSFYWLPSMLPFLGLGKTVFYRDFPIKRLSGMKAGLLRKWEERLKYENDRRMENTRFYSRRLGVRLPRTNVPCLRFPVLTDSRETRDRIFNDSRSRGLGVSLMYPAPVHMIEEIKDRFEGKTFPVAQKAAERLLALPTHRYVSGKDRENICALFEDRAEMAMRKTGRAIAR